MYCRYESCHEYTTKLGAADFLQFIDQLVFQAQSLDKVQQVVVLLA